MSSPTTYEEAYEETPTIDSNESGYASGSSSQDSLPDIFFSKPHLKFINSQLQKLEPQGMLCPAPISALPPTLPLSGITY